MVYRNRNTYSYLDQYPNPMDFYNYLQYLNFGGLIRADEGTQITRPFEFDPWKSQHSYIGDYELEGEDFDPYAEGEFTTSKIDKQRRKNEDLFKKQEGYLYDEDSGTQANWIDKDIKEGDNPLKNKKWKLYNTSDEEMFYNPTNPTKLYTDKEYKDLQKEDLAQRSVDLLNLRHEKNPDLFQKVTGYDSESGDITYEGDKLKGDLAADKNFNADYLQFNKPEDSDDFSFTGSYYADKEGDATGKVWDPLDQVAEEEQQYSFKPAQIGFEIDKPYPTAGSQMDVQRPMNTLSKFQEGNAVDWQSIYEKRGDMYKDMNLEDYKTEAMRQQGLYDQHGQWDYRSADEYGKHKQLQDLLGVSSQEVWDERMAPEGERMYDTLSNFEKKYVRNNLGVTEDELLSYYNHPDLSQRSAPSQNISAAEYSDMSPIQQKAFQDATGITDTKQNIQDDADMTDEELEKWWGSLSFDEQQELEFPGQSSFGPRYAPGKGENSWGAVGDFLWNITGAPISHGLDLLSMPVNLIAEGIEGLAGTGDAEFNWSGIVPAFRGDFSFDTMHGEGKRISNLIGMENSPGVAKFLVDVATDPVTWATLGTAGLAKGAASSGARAFSKEGAKAMAKNMARKYGPTAGKIAIGSGVAGLAAPHVFGSDPSKIDEMNELYAEDYDGQPSGGWNPYGQEMIDPNMMLAGQDQGPWGVPEYSLAAQYGGSLPTYATAGEYQYVLDDEGTYVPQSAGTGVLENTTINNIEDNTEMCSCDETIPASDTEKCEAACITKVSEKQEEGEPGEGADKFWKGYGDVIHGLGMINQMYEGKEADFSTNQLAHNQFQTDTRDNRGITDVNTGYQFQDKRVRARQGKAGTEMIDLNLPPVYTGPKYNLGMFTEKRSIDPWVNVRNSGMDISRNFPIGDSNLSLTPKIGFTDERFISDDLSPEILSEYFPAPSINPNFGLSLKYNFDEGGRTQQLRNRQYDDGDQHLNDLELDEDTIQELIAIGAEIKYL